MSKRDTDLMNTRITAGTEEIMKRTRKTLSMGIVMVSLLSLAGNAAAGNQHLTVKPKLTQKLDRVPIEHTYLPDVRVWTTAGDGAVVFPGENMKVKFRTDQDAFVVVLNVDTRGRVSKLFPARRFDDGFVRGGRTMKLPERGARYRLQVTGPPGVERVIAFASNEPIAHRWRSLLDDEDYGFRGEARFGRTGKSSAWGAAATIRTGNADLTVSAGSGPRLERKLIAVPVIDCGIATDETWFRIGRVIRRHGRYR